MWVPEYEHILCLKVHLILYQLVRVVSILHERTLKITQTLSMMADLYYYRISHHHLFCKSAVKVFSHWITMKVVVNLLVWKKGSSKSWVCLSLRGTDRVMKVLLWLNLVLRGPIEF